MHSPGHMELNQVFQGEDALQKDETRSFRAGVDHKMPLPELSCKVTFNTGTAGRENGSIFV